MTPRGLDFLGIGAVKAGTTSLHEYLRTHPALYLPEAKEQLYFTRDEAWEEGWEAFSAVAFYDAPADRRWGMVTAQCLGGPVLWRESTALAAAAPAHIVTARRIAAQFPDVKLIALLRDPIERAISSYWQSVVLGDEDRSIDQALNEELAEGVLESARKRPSHAHQYIVVGEYGRLLHGYLESFSRAQLFVGATSVLDQDPMRLLTELWRFLDVDDSHVPPNLDVRYQTRGTGRRSKTFGGMPVFVKRTPGVRHVWNALPPGVRTRLRARSRVFAHRFDRRARVDDTRLYGRPKSHTLERLSEHYAPDLALLEELVGHVPGMTSLPGPDPVRTW